MGRGAGFQWPAANAKAFSGAPALAAIAIGVSVVTRSSYQMLPEKLQHDPCHTRATGSAKSHEGRRRELETGKKTVEGGIVLHIPANQTPNTACAYHAGYRLRQLPTQPKQAVELT